jgi:hypothetical protein
MNTNIKRILRLGSLYHVRLECGHSFECSPDRLNQWQLYIGKRFDCGQCAGEEQAE